MEPTTSCCFASRAITELMPPDARREGKDHMDLLIDTIITAWIVSGLAFGIMTVVVFAIAFVAKFI